MSLLEPNDIRAAEEAVPQAFGTAENPVPEAAASEAAASDFGAVREETVPAVGNAPAAYDPIASAPAAPIPTDPAPNAAFPVNPIPDALVPTDPIPDAPVPANPAPHPGSESPAEPAVRCFGLKKNYGSVQALRNIGIELPAGRIIGLLGPNGSGKTTLIKILAGLLKPTEGEVSVFGLTPGTESKAIVSYLPERMYFNPGMRVEECIRLFRDFYGDFDERRAREMLGMLGVPANAKLKTLSKGTTEKVQLVLVMARRAKLYLLDEPIGGVDPAARDYILHTIVTACDPGATVLISTHLIRDVEPILDGFVFIGSGRCVMSGEAEAVRRDSGKTLDELFREVFRCY